MGEYGRSSGFLCMMRSRADEAILGLYSALSDLDKAGEEMTPREREILQRLDDHPVTRNAKA